MTRVVKVYAQDLWNLVEFVGLLRAIAIMFAIHGILLGLAGVNVRSYFKRSARASFFIPEFRCHHSPERGDAG